MKILSYMTTPNGTKILTVIGDARLDRRETEARAITHVQSLPEFARLADMIKESHALVKSLQSRRQKISDSAQYRDMLNQMASSKLELETLQAEYQAANPVYLTPANALIVDKVVADNIEADMKDGQFISLDIDEDGKGFSHDILTGEFMGKRHRMPGSLKWHINEYPDEVPPSDAIFTEPTKDEYAAARMETLKKRGPDAMAIAEAADIHAVEDAYVRAVVLADTLPSTEAKEAKRDAKEALTEAKKAIKARYKV